MIRLTLVLSLFLLAGCGTEPRKPQHKVNPRQADQPAYKRTDYGVFPLWYGSITDCPSGYVDLDGGFHS